MIYFDTTKARRSSHRSGLNRVSSRLLDELGDGTVELSWSKGAWRGADGRTPEWNAGDWVLTPELFSEDERPGFSAFLASRAVPHAAIFHDAIPLRMPEVTWPASVARHPSYMKLLATFDVVMPVSKASAEELAGYWRWLGCEARARICPVMLGADPVPCIQDSVTDGAGGEAPTVLQVGLLEPRKNQLFLLEVCEALWASGLTFRLRVAGRVNPHFGAPVLRSLLDARARGRDVLYEKALGDVGLVEAYRQASVFAFPTLAEGCGLPLLEALAAGLPCVCNDLPVLRETTAGGGCEVLSVENREGWIETLGRLIADPASRKVLADEARGRVLPTWKGTAELVLRYLRAGTGE